MERSIFPSFHRSSCPHRAVDRVGNAGEVGEQVSAGVHTEAISRAHSAEAVLEYFERRAEIDRRLVGGLPDPLQRAQ